MTLPVSDDAGETKIADSARLIGLPDAVASVLRRHVAGQEMGPPGSDGRLAGERPRLHPRRRPAAVRALVHRESSRWRREIGVRRSDSMTYGTRPTALSDPRHRLADADCDPRPLEHQNDGGAGRPCAPGNEMGCRRADGPLARGIRFWRISAPAEQIGIDAGRVRPAVFGAATSRTYRTGGVGSSHLSQPPWPSDLRPSASVASLLAAWPVHGAIEPEVEIDARPCQCLRQSSRAWSALVRGLARRPSGQPGEVDGRSDWPLGPTLGMIV